MAKHPRRLKVEVGEQHVFYHGPNYLDAPGDSLPKHWYRVYELRELARSRWPYYRLAATQLMRMQLRARTVVSYLDLARSMIRDRSNGVRWQSIVVVGEFIPTRPERVFDVVVAFAGTDRDMNIALGTVLLEHLLEEQCIHFCDRIERLIRNGRHAALLDVLGCCWRFYESDAEWSHVTNLLARRPKNKRPAIFDEPIGERHHPAVTPSRASSERRPEDGTGTPP